MPPALPVRQANEASPGWPPSGAPRCGSGRRAGSRGGRSAVDAGGLCVAGGRTRREQRQNRGSDGGWIQRFRISAAGLVVAGMRVVGLVGAELWIEGPGVGGWGGGAYVAP